MVAVFVGFAGAGSTAATGASSTTVSAAGGTRNDAHFFFGSDFDVLGISAGLEVGGIQGVSSRITDDRDDVRLSWMLHAKELSLLTTAGTLSVCIPRLLYCISTVRTQPEYKRLRIGVTPARRLLAGEGRGVGGAGNDV